jgi:SUR7/PalI family
MGFIRPATPGFLVTLVATVLLAVVCFCVPYLKSVYFLKANISVQGINGSITFGTLGYCLELSNGTTCSTPSVGYQLGEYLVIFIDSHVLKL